MALRTPEKAKAPEMGRRAAEPPHEARAPESHRDVGSRAERDASESLELGVEGASPPPQDLNPSRCSLDLHDEFTSPVRSE